MQCSNKTFSSTSTLSAPDALALMAALSSVQHGRVNFLHTPKAHPPPPVTELDAAGIPDSLKCCSPPVDPSLLRWINVIALLSPDNRVEQSLSSDHRVEQSLSSDHYTFWKIWQAVCSGDYFIRTNNSETVLDVNQYILSCLSSNHVS